MDKKYIIPGVLSFNTEKTNVITGSDSDFTLNSKRILTANDLQNAGAGTETVTNTATLNTGTITTMTVEGVSTTSVPLKFILDGSVVHMKIPTFAISAQSGTANTVNLGGAGIPAKYRPANVVALGVQTFLVPGLNNAVPASIFVTVDHNGLVYANLAGGANFTPIFSVLYTTVSWIIN